MIRKIKNWTGFRLVMLLIAASHGYGCAVGNKAVAEQPLPHHYRLLLALPPGMDRSELNSILSVYDKTPLGAPGVLDIKDGSRRVWLEITLMNSLQFSEAIAGLYALGIHCINCEKED